MSNKEKLSELSEVTEQNSEELVEELKESRPAHQIDGDVFNYIKRLQKPRLKMMSKNQLIDALIVMSIQQTELKQALKQLMEEKESTDE